jgi:hypothetical protein
LYTDLWFWVPYLGVWARFDPPRYPCGRTSSGVESFVGNLGGVGGDAREAFEVPDDSIGSLSLFSSFESRNMELVELID